MIESAEGVWLVDTEGRRYIDGVSSLWCNVHGHRHPHIDAAVRDQLDRVAHTTMLGPLAPGRRGAGAAAGRDRAGLARRARRAAEPRLLLRQRLDRGRGRAQDGVPVLAAGRRAAARAHQVRVPRERLPRRHGRARCRSAGSTCSTRMYRPLLFDAHRVPAGDVAALDAGARRSTANEIAAVVVEPLVQGAAGMLLQPPGYLRAVRGPVRRATTCSSSATRSRPASAAPGRMFACEHEGVVPDFLCLAKGLTGGYMPLAATLTTERVYEAFLGEYEEFQTFFHGHTYTGNPLACAAALATLEVFEQERTLERLQDRDRAARRSCSTTWSSRCRTCARSAAGLHVRHRAGDRDDAYARAHGPPVTLEARARGAIVRPLGDVVVLMPPLSIEADVLEELVEIVADSIAAATASASAASYRSRRRRLLLVRARSPSCARRRPGRTSRPGSSRTACPARCRRRGRPRPGRR